MTTEVRMFSRSYTLRRASKTWPAFVTSVPDEVLKEVAETQGLTVDEFAAQHNVRWSFRGDDIHMEFVKK